MLKKFSLNRTKNTPPCWRGFAAYSPPVHARGSAISTSYPGKAFIGFIPLIRNANKAFIPLILIQGMNTRGSPYGLHTVDSDSDSWDVHSNLTYSHIFKFT